MAKVVAFSGQDVQVKVANGDSKTLPITSLQRVIPAKNDKVRVHDPNYAGKEGTLTAVDGQDAVVKVTQGADVDFLCVEMDNITKLASF